MTDGLIPSMSKDDTPYLDSSFSFYTSDTSPLDSPRLDDQRKLSTLSGQPSQNPSYSTLSRKPPKVNSLMAPNQSKKKFLLPQSREGSLFKPGGELMTPGSRGSKMSRRSIFQVKASPRPSKVMRVLPVCAVGEQTLPVEDLEANKNKEQVKPARQKGKDLNKMSMEELLDLAVRILKKDPAKRNMRELQALSRCVSQVNFFKECDEDTALKCLRHMSYEKFKTNQSVFEINTIGTTFWVILRGSVGVWVSIKKVIGTDANGDNITEDVLTEVKTLPPGSSFGELALLDKGKRSATIVCKEECEFAVLEKSHFVGILKEKETRKLYTEVDFLVSLPLLQTWSYNAVKLLYYNTTIKKYKRGHVFYEEGDIPQTMYIVRSGELKVLKQVGIKEKKKGKDSLEKPKGPILKRTLEMGIIGEKGIIGEEELLSDSKRKYKVVCYSLEAEVCEISKSVFLERVLKFVQTKEWLTNYVTTRENYYEIRLKNMNENNSSLAYSSASPKPPVSSRAAKERSQTMKSPSIGEGLKDNSTPVKQIPSNFLRGMPKKPTRRISPECRVVHTESDAPRSESSSVVPKLNIPLGNQGANDYYNAGKEQQNNERLLNEQMDLRTYDTPIWRQVKGQTAKTLREKKKQMTWSPRSPEFDVPLSSFRDEFERLKKKVTGNGEPIKSARNEADRETPLFYFKIEQNITKTLPTEESEHNQTVVVPDTKPSITNDYAGHDYGLERKSGKTTRPQTAKHAPPNLTKRVPKLPMALQSWGGIRDASVFSYNHTITESSDMSLSSRTYKDKEFLPMNQHTFLNKMRQAETFKSVTPARPKKKTENDLCIQGITASMSSVGFSTDRSSVRKLRPSFVQKKSTKKLSTSVEGAKSLSSRQNENGRYTLTLPKSKSGTMGFI